MEFRTLFTHVLRIMFPSWPVSSYQCDIAERGVGTSCVYGYINTHRCTIQTRQMLKSQEHRQQQHSVQHPESDAFYIFITFVITTVTSLLRTGTCSEKRIVMQLACQAKITECPDTNLDSAGQVYDAASRYNQGMPPT